MTGAWSYDTLGDPAVRAVPKDRTTTTTFPPVNRVGRSPPAAFRQVVPTPVRGTERYTSRITYSDIRPNEATSQPHCRQRRQSVFRRDAQAISAAPLALLAPLLVTLLPFYVRFPSVWTPFSYSPLVSLPYRRIRRLC